MPIVKVHKNKCLQRKNFRYLLEKEKVLLYAFHHFDKNKDLLKQFNKVFKDRKRKPQKNEWKWIHIIISFNELTPSKENLIGYLKDFIKETGLNDYQYLVAVHKDTVHYNAHILLNPISLTTHLKIRYKNGFIMKLRRISDKVGKKYGFASPNVPYYRKNKKRWFDWERYRASIPLRKEFARLRNEGHINLSFLNQIYGEEKEPKRIDVGTGEMNSELLSQLTNPPLLNDDIPLLNNDLPS